MMVMTEKLADQLMDSLCCVAISANGGYSPNISEENFQLAQTYAREKFMQIVTEWEVLMGEEWDIVSSEDAA